MLTGLQNGSCSSALFEAFNQFGCSIHVLYLVSSTVQVLQLQSIFCTQQRELGVQVRCISSQRVGRHHSEVR